jgi:eukaryotic-like serine/threonine-protein kinase
MPHGGAVGDGRYQLLDYLGSGNFGEVWHARDRDFEDDVAIKLFQPAVLFDDVVAEARLQNLSRHEFVVRVLNVVIQGPIPFIVMEHLALGSAEARLVSNQVSLVESVRWIRNLLDGLYHAHSRGVIHRDVKPANMLLKANGTAALSDFGLAEETIRRLIRERYVPHAAPELFGGAPSSVQTDLWAAGCTLYRLLTGTHPFTTVGAIQRGTFVPAHQLNPQVPLRLDRTIASALEVNTARRFQTAPDMIASVAGCGVRYSWEAVPGRPDAWRWIGGPHGHIQVELRTTRQGGFEIYGTRDRGSGPRRFLRPTFNSEARARQALRRLLLQGVAGDNPR